MDDAESGITKVTWDFFTSTNDLIGPDVRLLEILTEKNIGFVLWIG